jgi:hypothetical protein
MILVCYCSEYSDLKTVLVLLFLSSTTPVHSRGNPQIPAFLSDLISFVSPIKSEMISIDDVEGYGRLDARQATVDACDTQCSWVIQTESCNNNVACDCQIIGGAGVSGVANCANCLQSINATLASQAVQVGEDCGVTAIPSLTFSFVTTSTSIKTGAPASGATTVPTTTSVPIFTIPPVVPSNIASSSSTIISSSPSASNTSGNLSSPPTETSSGSSGLSGGAIGGIVGGIVGTFIILAALLVWWIRRYRSSFRRPVPLPITPVAPQPPAPKLVESAPASLPTILTPLPTIVEDVPSGRLRYPDEVLGEPESPEGARLSRAY